MGLFYENLEEVRVYMVEEEYHDVANDNLYISYRLNSRGRRHWSFLLKEALIRENDDWLAKQLSEEMLMKTRVAGADDKIRKVPINANTILAEGEFNRFYLRGLCCYAIDQGVDDLIIYRGRDSEEPRKKSRAKIGARISAKRMLADLRSTQGTNSALGLPPGPNSGLTARLPRTYESLVSDGSSVYGTISTAEPWFADDLNVPVNRPSSTMESMFVHY